MKANNIEIDPRDRTVVNCQSSEVRGFGKQFCSNCACSKGTVYADGYQAGCVNIQEEEEEV